MKLYKNPDKMYTDRIESAVLRNSMFCPCAVLPDGSNFCNPATIGFPNTINVDQLCEFGQGQGRCICGIYRVVEDV